MPEEPECPRLTAQAFADLLHARPAGRGRWQALCPTHPDRSPSLSIKEGREGRVVLLCRSHGCGARAIVAAVGLTMGHLFPDAPAGAAGLRAAREHKAKREAQEAEESRRRGVSRAVVDAYRRLACVVDSLGSRLAWCPDGAPEGDGLAALYHRAADMLNRADSARGVTGWVKSSLVKPLGLWPPSVGAPAERAEADRVVTEAQLLRFLETGYAEPPAPAERV